MKKYAEEVVRRESKLVEKPFPFEVIHTDGPASNMTMFHWHDFMEISYIKQGEGVYEIEDKMYHVKPGDIIIINNIERHRVTYKSEYPLYETVIHFEPKLIWAKENSSFDYSYLKLFLYNGASFTNKLELSNELAEIITGLINDIAEEYAKREQYFELMIKSKLLTMITYLIRECSVKQVNDYDQVVKRNNIGRLEKILKFINENFENNLNADMLAQKFYMNSSYFSEYFKKNMGVNFSEYLSKLRINKAAELLKENRLGSTEIAYACGFNNTASFYNAFKKITGTSPGSYKKQVTAKG